MRRPIRYPTVRGPLAVHVDDVRAELERRGYAALSVRNRLWLLAHLSGWLESEGLGVDALTSRVAARYMAHRRALGYKTWVAPQSINLLTECLQHLGVAPREIVPVPATPVEALVADYRRYLVTERGLAASTVMHYVTVAARFVSTCWHDGELDMTKLDGRVVARIVGAECARCRSVSAAKYSVAGTRSLLRYLHLAGVTSRSLVSATPSVAKPARGLPRGLEAAHVRLLLGSCDRRRAVGRRDYAILVLLVRFGLRAAEVAALTLDDIDWRAGQITIRGKGARVDRLPLPDDVGEAVVAYLRRGRPRGEECRSLFLRVKAPAGGLGSRGVAGVVAHACRRAGLPVVGAHRLRHTTATELLRRGASLNEIGQLLRHRSTASTAIYAKVDHSSLRTLALPWPGSAS